MIPYYSPNFGIQDLLYTLVSGHSVAQVQNFFRDLTGKSHVLITSSCRSALYLAYQCLGKSGVVHVSPLTCQVALHPIIASGNKIKFHDVKLDDWTLDPALVEQGISQDSLAIQAVHLGGFLCDMPAFRRIADEKGLILIEDCAQGFGASLDGTMAGSWGDISCFTLTKNVYGLGGGILTTDNRDLYNRAKVIQDGFDKEPQIKVLNRVVNAVLSSSRESSIPEMIYRYLNHAKYKYLAKTDDASDELLQRQLRFPSSLYARSMSGRLAKIERLNTIRNNKAHQLIKLLDPLGFEFQANVHAISSYTKLFCRHPMIDAKDFIRDLNYSGVEAMHLEHKYGVFYQPKLTSLMQNNFNGSLKNYESIHDRLLSLPLHESINTKTMRQIQTHIERQLPCKANAS